MSGIMKSGVDAMPLFILDHLLISYKAYNPLQIPNYLQFRGLKVQILNWPIPWPMADSANIGQNYTDIFQHNSGKTPSTIMPKNLFPESETSTGFNLGLSLQYAMFEF